jgi:hypothetical protein
MPNSSIQKNHAAIYAAVSINIIPQLDAIANHSIEVFAIIMCSINVFGVRYASYRVR